MYIEVASGRGLSLDIAEPYRRRDYSHDCILLHAGSSIHVLRCYDGRYASRATELHYYRQRLDYHWWCYPGGVLLGAANYCVASHLCKFQLLFYAAG